MIEYGANIVPRRDDIHNLQTPAQSQSPALPLFSPSPLSLFLSPPSIFPTTHLLPITALLYSPIMSADLTRVDSAVAGLSISGDKAPASTEKEVKKDAKKPHRRTSSQSGGVWNIKDLGQSS